MQLLTFHIYIYLHSCVYPDFVIDDGEKVMPIEVKAEVNLMAKILKVYNEKFNPKFCIRTSMTDYEEQEWLINYRFMQLVKLREIEFNMICVKSRTERNL